MRKFLSVVRWLVLLGLCTAMSPRVWAQQSVPVSWQQGLSTSRPPTCNIGQGWVSSDTGLVSVCNAGAWVGAGNGVAPVFASYLIYENGSTYYALNNLTGHIDYSGTDAGPVINDAIGNMPNGGTLYFKNGVYNINSLLLNGSTYYGIGLPLCSGTQSCQWFLTGESRPLWPGESSAPIQTNGVIFNITATAMSSVSSTAYVAGIFALPQSGNQYIDVFENNIGIRFPTNQRASGSTTIGSDMYNAGDISYYNVVADFDIQYSSLTPDPNNTDAGLTSTVSEQGNMQRFINVYSAGWYYGFDIQSEHSVADNMTSIYSVCAGRLESAGYAGSWREVNDQENQRGWIISASGPVDIWGYNLEAATYGTWNRVSNLSENIAGNSYGLISYTVHTQGGGAITDFNLWNPSPSGDGKNFTMLYNGNLIVPMLAQPSNAGSSTINNLAGTCTLSSGVCSAITFTTAWQNAPVCMATWTGTGTLTGLLKAVTTTTTLTISSSILTDSAVIGYICAGNPN